MSLRLRNPLKMLRSNAVALDMGSGQTRIASREGDLLLDEPSVVALEHAGTTVLVAGTEAKSYIGKAPERIRIVRPIEAGAVLDFDAAREMLRTLLGRVAPADGTRLKVCAVVAQGLTDLERRTFSDCIKAAGAGRVDLVRAPLAAAAGAGLDIAQPKGRLLLGIGHGLTEASVVSLSDVVHAETVRCGAHAFHEAVARQLAERHKISIGENMAEQATLRLFCAEEPDAPRRLTVTGKYAETGTPCALELTHADLDGALDGVLAEVEGLARSVMEHAPAELVADIGETGLLLYGGGARLCGLEGRLAKRLNLPVIVVQNPGLACLRGALAALGADQKTRSQLLR